jgi:hypothetical protein
MTLGGWWRAASSFSHSWRQGGCGPVLGKETMKRSPYVLVLIISIAVVAFEAAVHWLLSGGRFPTLLAVYLTADSPSEKHFFAGVLDNQLPAAVLGYVAGWAGYPRWSPRKVFVVVVLLSCLVAGLEPIYRVLLGPQNHAIVWGSPNSLVESALSHLYDVFTAFVIGGVFSYGGYGGHRALATKKPSNAAH